MAYKDPEGQARWRKEHPNAARDANLKRNYGITPQEWQAMIAAQRGVCLICQKAPVGKHNQGTLHVDHDHKTGKVRGLLCSNCNRGLGLFADDPRLLRRASLYLEGVPLKADKTDWR